MTSILDEPSGIITEVSDSRREELPSHWGITGLDLTENEDGDIEMYELIQFLTNSNE